MSALCTHRVSTKSGDRRVEASIRYLPLYPDDRGIVFNEQYLTNSKNILAEILPEFAHLSDIISVIDVPGSSSGCVLEINMNANEERAIAYLSEPA